jgi:hypothetical protein
LVGSEDKEELLQDGLIMAFRMLQSAENVGKSVTAGNVAYYTLKHLRSGRRSTGSRSTDPLHPVTQLSGRSIVLSLEEPLPGDEPTDEPLTLGETLATRQDDPAIEAARRLDWGHLISVLDVATKRILHALASGSELTLLARESGRSRSTLCNDKQRLARLIRDYLGDDILRQVQEHPVWRNSLAADKERMACRWERRDNQK